MKKTITAISCALLMFGTMALNGYPADCGISSTASSKAPETLSAVVLKPLETGLNEMRQTAWEEAQKEFDEKGYDAFKDDNQAPDADDFAAATARCTYYLQHLHPMLDAAYEEIGSDLMETEGIAENRRVPYSSDHRVIYLDLTDEEKQRISENEKVLMIEPLKPYERSFNASEPTVYFDFTPEQKIDKSVSEKLKENPAQISVVLSFVEPYNYVSDEMTQEAKKFVDAHPEIPYFEDIDFRNSGYRIASAKLGIPLIEERCRAALKYEEDKNGFKSTGELGLNASASFAATVTLSPDEIQEIANLPEVSRISLYEGGSLWIVPPTVNPTDVSDQLKKGDVNSDNSINILDVICLNKYILGKADFSNVQFAAADINNDGKVNSDDSLKILKYALGIIDSFDM